MSYRHNRIIIDKLERKLESKEITELEFKRLEKIENDIKKTRR